jgi:hypothetical protein
MTQCSYAFERDPGAFERTCKTAISYYCANERAVLRSSAPLLPASTYERQYVLFFFLISFVYFYLLIILICF